MTYPDTFTISLCAVCHDPLDGDFQEVSGEWCCGFCAERRIKIIAQDEAEQAGFDADDAQYAAELAAMQNGETE